MSVHRAFCSGNGVGPLVHDPGSAGIKELEIKASIALSGIRMVLPPILHRGSLPAAAHFLTVSGCTLIRSAACTNVRSLVQVIKAEI